MEANSAYNRPLTPAMERNEHAKARAQEICHDRGLGAPINQGIIGGSSQRDKSELEMQMDDCNRAISTLEQTLLIFLGRLNPVLRPAEKMEQPQDCMPARQTDLTKLLQEGEMRIISLSRIIDDTARRLAV